MYTDSKIKDPDAQFNLEPQPRIAYETIKGIHDGTRFRPTH
jgi:hypothetical protein